MRKAIAKLLRRFGAMSFDLLSTVRNTYPDPATMATGDLVIVQDGDVTKWACLICPGGCGNCISLSLNPERRPRWRVLTDFWTRPSVHQTNACGCHFWIRKGRIDWCKDGRPAPRAPAK